jgi:cytochrome c
MDSFELNKIIGAILGTLLFVMGAGFLAEAIYEPIQGRGPGYELPEAEPEHGGEEVPEEVQVDIGTLLAAANVQQGEASAKKCAGCHNFAEGAGNKQGPELFGVVARPIASLAGFSYSEALLAHSADVWSYDNLDHFLLAPKGFAPGTKMNFGGLKNPEERANVIAYLASITPSAPAFPAPAPVNATAEADPATTEAGTEPAVAGDADAVETRTETQSETPVEGTPISSADTTEGTPVEPAATETPAAPAPDAEIVPEVTTTTP